MAELIVSRSYAQAFVSHVEDALLHEMEQRCELLTIANQIMRYAIKCAIADITCGARYQEYNDPDSTLDVCDCALAHSHGNQKLLPELEAA